MGLLSGEGRSVLPCQDRGGKMVEVTERRTDIDSTKAAINFYDNVKANTKTNLMPTGNGTAGFEVYVEIGPLKGPLFKVNVPCLMLTPTLKFVFRLKELAN